MKVTFTSEIKPRDDDSTVPLAVRREAASAQQEGWPVTTSVAQQVSYISGFLMSYVNNEATFPYENIRCFCRLLSCLLQSHPPGLFSGIHHILPLHSPAVFLSEHSG